MEPLLRETLGMLAASTLLMTAATSAVPASAQSPVPVRTVSRISMVALHPETLKRFYRDVLGFQLISEGVVGGETDGAMIAKAWNLDPGAKLHGIVLRAPHGDMELQITSAVGQTLKQVVRGEKKAPLAGDHYFTLYIPDLNEAVRRMKAYGTPFHRGPMVMTSLDRTGKAYSVYEAVISDPEGTILILVDTKKI